MRHSAPTSVSDEPLEGGEIEGVEEVAGALVLAVDRSPEDVPGDVRAEVAPEELDGVEVGALDREPDHLDAVADMSEEVAHGVRVVVRRPIGDEDQAVVWGELERVVEV